MVKCTWSWSRCGYMPIDWHYFFFLYMRDERQRKILNTGTVTLHYVQLSCQRKEMVLKKKGYWTNNNTTPSEQKGGEQMKTYGSRKWVYSVDLPWGPSGHINQYGREWKSNRRRLIFVSAALFQILNLLVLFFLSNRNLVILLITAQQQCIF